MSQNIRKRKAISQEVRNVIIRLRRVDKSYGEIARTIGSSHATNRTVLKNTQ